MSTTEDILDCVLIILTNPEVKLDKHGKITNPQDLIDEMKNINLAKLEPTLSQVWKLIKSVSLMEKKMEPPGESRVKKYDLKNTTRTNYHHR